MSLGARTQSLANLEMRAFLKCFSEQDVIITLADKTFSKADCELLGEGSQKRVYSLRGEKDCFIIPNGFKSGWEFAIRTEKRLCDDILQLGLRAQAYEIKPLRIQRRSGGIAYTIPVMVTRDLSALVRDEGISIYNPKGERNKHLGRLSLYQSSSENLASKTWNLALIENNIKEYALALAYKLPIHQVTSPDDSLHLYVKSDENGRPHIHYFFWDVLGDFGGLTLPRVPTLATLKKGLHSFSEEVDGLKTFVNNIACAMSNEEMVALGFMDGEYVDTFAAVRAIETALMSVLTDDVLTQAIGAAREHAIIHLTQKFNALASDITSVSEHDKVQLVCSAISTDNLNCVQAAMRLVGSNVVQDNQAEILRVAEYYNHADILNLFRNRRTVFTPSFDQQSRLPFSSKLLNVFVHGFARQFLERIASNAEAINILEQYSEAIAQKLANKFNANFLARFESFSNEDQVRFLLLFASQSGEALQSISKIRYRKRL